MASPGKVLAIRFCKVSKRDHSAQLATMLGPKGLGLTPIEMPVIEGLSGFQGEVFPVGDTDGSPDAMQQQSWIELWPSGDEMPEMVMLQIVVDNADKFADHARKNGLDPKGPDDAHGERIYYLEGPGGLPIAFLSKSLTDTAG